MRQESRRRRAGGLRAFVPADFPRAPPDLVFAGAGFALAFAGAGFFAALPEARVVLRGRFGGGERRRLAIWLRRAEA